jgi:hypothetical protein
MKYGDELDRITEPALSRRQFLTAGGHRAARLAADLLVPGADSRPPDVPMDPAGDENGEPPERRQA